MVAKIASEIRVNEVNEVEGQSVIEFVLMLPLLLGMSILIMKINTVIQVSIVNQQYARSQALFLAYNSPFFPEKTKQAFQIQRGLNQLIAGVSGNLASGDTYTPAAAVVDITRGSKNPAIPKAPDASQEEPASARSKVRVRNTVTLCTQTLLMGFGGKGGPVQILADGGSSILVEGDRPGQSFCGSVMQYVMDK